MSKVADSVILKCLGADNNPKYQYLNGGTVDGSVDLAPSTDGIYTGTRWQVEPLSGGGVAFKCLGSDNNLKYQYLNGGTADGSVDLAPSTDGIYTGTRWNV